MLRPTTDEQVGVALAAGPDGECVVRSSRHQARKAAAKSASTTPADSGNVLTRFGGVVLVYAASAY